MLRKPAVEREATYRILVDEIPPPPAPGTVRIALRLLIPVFAAPAARAAAQLRWRVERDGTQAWLVAANTGNRHASVRDIALVAPTGETLAVTVRLPYVLAGATRRWPLAAPPPAIGQVLRLTARDDARAIDAQVPVTPVEAAQVGVAVDSQ